MNTLFIILIALSAFVIVCNFGPETVKIVRYYITNFNKPKPNQNSIWQIVSVLEDESGELRYILSYSNDGYKWYNLRTFESENNARMYLSKILKSNKIIHEYNPHALLNAHENKED